MFDIACGSEDPADYQSYLDAFPNGVFASMARNAIERNTTQVAALEPTPTVPVQQTRSIQAFGPLLLSVTPALTMLPSSEATENALFMDKQARRVLQARLNGAGQNVGRADGSLGKKSRAGIRNWQASQGLTATGYMNQPQMDLLVTQTEATYQQHLTAAATAPRKSSGKSSSGKKRSNNSNAAVNSFLNGLGQGIGSRLGN